ncbi:MAG: DUF4105 domain-containing protein [Candidatus Margulisbacteria bacterium]|jgi:hypothetical protein|nr:DUF4105 domain-containing protein [Candidatus Margulisiibacteriota bacterium]
MIKKFLGIGLLILALAGAEEYCYSREWLNLLYYEQTLSGYRSLAAYDSFFVAPQGRTDPQAEYAASLRLVEQNDADFKTKFPLRYKYIARQNNLPYAPAVVLTENIANLALAYPNRYMRNPVSMFGHLFLILETDRGFLDSRILHYVADTGGDAQDLLYAIKGLSGKYPGAFYKEQYYKKIKEYNYLEDREVFYYDLKLTPEQLEDLQLHYIELQNTIFYYYFLDANCAFYIGKLLNAVLPTDIVRGGVYILPADIINNLRRQNWLAGARLRSTATETFNNLYNALTGAQKARIKSLLTVPAAKDVDADLETLKAFLAISEFMISNKSYLAETIRRNRILAYQKLREHNVYNLRPAFTAAAAQNIDYHSWRLTLSPQESAQLEFTPIHFTERLNKLNVKDVRLLGFGLRTAAGQPPLVNFDLLEIDNLGQSNLILPAVSWSAKSQFAYRETFLTNQELYLGCAVNLLNKGLFSVLAGGNYANYDDLAARSLGRLDLLSGLKTEWKQNLTDSLQVLLGYEHKYKTDYQRLELAYDRQSFLGRITFLNSVYGANCQLSLTRLF